jgi:hypothetical protein
MLKNTVHAKLQSQDKIPSTEPVAARPAIVETEPAIDILRNLTAKSEMKRLEMKNRRKTKITEYL